jgi:hypothetical protein
MDMLIGVAAVMIGTGFVAACFFLAMRSEGAANESLESARRAELAGTRLQEDRNRITTNEREWETLRRELRKLSGKFYASEREREEQREEYVDEDAFGGPGGVDYVEACENWQLAKIEGPQSAAAACTCLYCMTQRAARARARSELVPKTVQSVAQMATLNAGKP